MINKKMEEKIKNKDKNINITYQLDLLTEKYNAAKAKYEETKDNQYLEIQNKVKMLFVDGQGYRLNSAEEAEAFLEDCMAVVVHSVKEVREYFEEEGVDLEGADEEEILNADEVFDIGDGRYLIVEG